MPCNRKKQKELKRLRDEPVIVESVVEEKIEETVVEPIVEKTEEVVVIEPVVEKTEEIVVIEPVIETVVKKTEDELLSLNKSELIALAEQLGLDTKGTKSELIARILGE